MAEGTRVLLVDDERDFSYPMSLWFKSKGYSVTVVSSGEDALRIIKKEPPDIVFLDIVMPKMDGYTTLKLVREFNKTIPVVMMSAYEKESTVKKKVHFYGVFGFFDKGQDFSKALALLESALGTDENLK